MAKKKNEGSRVSNVVTPDSQMLQGFAGSHYDPSFRTKGEDSPVQRHRKKHPSKKALRHRSTEESKAFAESVVKEVLGIKETVRKSGTGWALYDDETGNQVGTYKDRKDAWKQQRLVRQRNKATDKPDNDSEKKDKKSVSLKPVKAQVKQTKKTPKVKNVKGVKKIKPISPIKPIKPKGLRLAKKEAFETQCVGGILREHGTK